MSSAVSLIVGGVLIVAGIVGVILAVMIVAYLIRAASTKKGRAQFREAYENGKRGKKR